MADIIYTDTMTGTEYNAIRASVDWKPLTDGQAERGLEHTTFLVVARDGEKAVGMGSVMFIMGAAKGKEKFYEKMGFEIRPNEFSGPGMTKWMKKCTNV